MREQSYRTFAIQNAQHLLQFPECRPNGHDLLHDARQLFTEQIILAEERTQFDSCCRRPFQDDDSFVEP